MNSILQDCGGVWIGLHGLERESFYLMGTR